MKMEPITRQESELRRMIRERQDWPRGSSEWLWRTKAAWTLLQVARRIPSTQWTPYHE